MNESDEVSSSQSSSQSNSSQFRMRRGRPRSRPVPYQSRKSRFERVKSAKPQKPIFFLTIPRCTLSREYVYEGFNMFCERLIVAKEMHTLSYNNSCCKNSSVTIEENSKVTVNRSDNESGTEESFEYDDYCNRLIRGDEIESRDNIAITLRQQHCNSHFHIFAGFLADQNL